METMTPASAAPAGAATTPRSLWKDTVDRFRTQRNYKRINPIPALKIDTKGASAAPTVPKKAAELEQPSTNALIVPQKDDSAASPQSRAIPPSRPLPRGVLQQQQVAASAVSPAPSSTTAPSTIKRPQSTILSSLMPEKATYQTRLRRVTTLLSPLSLLSQKKAPSVTGPVQLTRDMVSVSSSVDSDVSSVVLVQNLAKEQPKLGTLCCNVLQVTCPELTRDLDFELHLQLQGKTIAVRHGELRKHAKSYAICHLPDVWLAIQLDYPEDLAFVLYTQPVRGLMMKPSMSTPGKMKDYVAQQAARLPRMKRSVSKSIDSRTRTMAGYKKVMTAPLASFSSSSSSSLRSSLRDDASVVQSGQRLYQLEAPQHQQQPFEILVDFQWQWAPVTEVTTVRPHRLNHHAPNDVSSTAATATSATPSYPWLKYNMDAVSPLSPDLENPEILFANKEAIQSALHHADNGDFLTFYVHGIAYPEWKRYWVTLEHHRLLLRPFAYKNKDPVHAIPLQQLVQVSKPTEEDQEYICLNRQLGAVLQFELPTMPSRLRESVWSGPGGSKVYMLADHADAALNWRRALTFHVLTLAQQQQDFPATLHDQENIYNIDYSRFLW